MHDVTENAPSVEQAYGNAEVVTALEKHLALAREGQMSYIAIARFTEPNMAGMYFGGATWRTKPMLQIVQSMLKGMDGVVENETLPARDLAKGAEFVTYNVPASPLSYDFLAWLVDAELTRIRENAPSPLHVGFFFGRDGCKGLDLSARQQMFYNVILPACKALGAQVTEDIGGRFKEVFSLRDVTAAGRRGELMPTFHAFEEAREAVAERRFVTGNRAPVTITLRECDSWPHRNSNKWDWVRFARWLEDQGEYVVFVRDTACAEVPLPGCVTDPRASYDLGYRIALYNSAKANLFTSNGPWTLALFGDRPWLMFIEMFEDGHPYTPNTPKFWRENIGVEPGQQFPWSAPKQRIVWEKDNFPAMVEAWRNFISPSA